MSEKALFLKALSGEQTKRPPVWFMRQAGRYLPEYQAIRSKHSMLDVIRTPELAAEVTLQPIRRFGMDASIIFADILNVLIGMGADLEFVKGVGPVISNPVRSLEDINNLLIPDVEENSSYTMEAIKIVCEELDKTNTPLIGFAGSPFTMSSYLIEGKSPQKLINIKALMFSDFSAWDSLQNKLVEVTASYLVAQVKAGAKALQLFDSWAGGLGLYEYSQFVFPYLEKLILLVKSEVDVPIIYFAPNTAGYTEKFKSLNVSGVGVDWRIPMLEMDKRLDSKFVLQGNLDPLIAAGDRDYLKLRVKAHLEESSTLKTYIFNTGHGLLPHTPPDNIAMIVDIVKEFESDNS